MFRMQMHFYARRKLRTEYVYDKLYLPDYSVHDNRLAS